jgi:hypothetical protein
LVCFPNQRIRVQDYVQPTTPKRDDGCHLQEWQTGSKLKPILRGSNQPAFNPQTQSKMKRMFVIKNGMVIGSVSNRGGGFSFIPYTASGHPSRKLWPTPEAAVKGRVSGATIIHADSFKDALAAAETLKASADRLAESRA